MTSLIPVRIHTILLAPAILLFTCTASAVEVADLAGLESIFGRYAPGGDCSRQPQILVELSGLTFEIAGASERVTNPEYAASYGGQGYEGITQWIFPFRIPEGYAILMTFNANEQQGTLLIEPHDEGWPGGPPLRAQNEILVTNSPYALCTDASPQGPEL